MLSPSVESEHLVSLRFTGHARVTKQFHAHVKQKVIAKTERNVK